MHNFKQLDVWKKSMKLVEEIYKVTNAFPKSEQFGLNSQMCRCAVSIPSNIAEGAGRSSDRDFSRFLSIALGSSYELETQILLCRNLNFISESLEMELSSKLNEIQKMTWTLLNKFNKSKV